MTEKERDLVETVDENGNAVTFELFDIVEVDDKEYALLLPENHEESEEETDVVVMRLITEGDDYVFEAIEDDEEFEKVSEFIDNMED